MDNCLIIVLIRQQNHFRKITKILQCLIIFFGTLSHTLGANCESVLLRHDVVCRDVTVTRLLLAAAQRPRVFTARHYSSNFTVLSL